MLRRLTFSFAVTRFYIPDRDYYVACPAGLSKHSRTGISDMQAVRMIHIDTSHTLGQSLRAARRQLGLTQAQLALAAGVGLRFIVDLEAGKSTLQLEPVLRVVNALGGELSLGGLASASGRSLYEVQHLPGHAQAKTTQPYVALRAW